MSTFKELAKTVTLGNIKPHKILTPKQIYSRTYEQSPFSSYNIKKMNRGFCTHAPFMSGVTRGAIRKPHSPHTLKFFFLTLPDDMWPSSRYSAPRKILNFQQAISFQ